MKTLFINKQFKYDGTQLTSLYAYLNHNLMGPSIISWIGPCEVSFSHMIDGEDLLDQSPICGDQMVHFIVEVFDQDLFSGVLVQRLLASLISQYVFENKNIYLRRSGDDLYFNDQKFSISIASHSIRSVMVHFAVNVTQRGTPVRTVGLEDLNIDPQKFSIEIMEKWKNEYISTMEATWKVKPLS